MKVSSSAIDLHNQWCTTELSKGQKSKKLTSNYYTGDLCLTINLQLEDSGKGTEKNDVCKCESVTYEPVGRAKSIADSLDDGLQLVENLG